MIIDIFISARAFFLVTYLHISTACSLPVVDLGYELHQAFSLNFLTSYFTNATFSASLDVSSYPVPLIQDPRISEDCLFLDVVVPQKVFGRAQGKTPVPKESLAPVIVYFYGGGHALGNKGGVDPSGLIQRSQQQGKDGVIHVALNYRLGAFGWLAGHTVSRKGTPNAALHDQLLGLTWAILQSPAWEPNYDTDKQERTFRQYLKLLNVSTIEEARQLPSEKLIAANTHQVSSSPYGTFTYGPVVDGVFVPDPPGKLLLRGEFDHSVKILNGHTLNEALIYTPPSSFQE
ncbi:carboxylesterase [Aspergillus arachidicola]|uniref:Carboxylesterase n=1 Tax=Aspergillus arachidicola TaxID=656916 RepID=A0A2G7FLN6_9EURO|nr:carboxylesterase [Aspergillus arachidicola]